MLTFLIKYGRDKTRLNKPITRSFLKKIPLGTGNVSVCWDSVKLTSLSVFLYAQTCVRAKVSGSATQDLHKTPLTGQYKPRAQFLQFFNSLIVRMATAPAFLCGFEAFFFFFFKQSYELFIRLEVFKLRKQRKLKSRQTYGNAEVTSPKIQFYINETDARSSAGC